MEKPSKVINIEFVYNVLDYNMNAQRKVVAIGMMALAAILLVAPVNAIWMQVDNSTAVNHNELWISNSNQRVSDGINVYDITSYGDGHYGQTSQTPIVARSAGAFQIIVNLLDTGSHGSIGRSLGIGWMRVG
jgi:hypothetical protein